MPFTEDMNYRINQALAEAGVPVVMPEDWDEINAMAFAVDALGSFALTEFDSNPMGQAQAAEILRRVVRPASLLDPWGLPSLVASVSEPQVDTRWCPDYDETDYKTTRLRALVYDRKADVMVWVPLTDIAQLDEVVQAYFDATLVCQAHNVPDCDYFKHDPQPSADRPLDAYALKRGELVVIMYVCPLCRSRMNNPDWTHCDYVGRGAWPWYDEAPERDDDLWADAPDAPDAADDAPDDNDPWAD